MKDADKSVYLIVPPHTFAYNPARINVGSIGYWNGNENVIVSSLYEIFQTTEHIDDRFLWHWFKSNSFNRLVMKLQEGGVRLYFYYDKLCMGNIYLPSKAEQQKIGIVFDRIDVQIQIEESKLQQLQNFKQSMLAKMFPKDGETKPEIRFKGFTNDWEQRKLGDMVNVCSGMDYKHLLPGNIPVYGTGGYMLSVNKALSYDRDAIGIGRKGTINKPYILKAPFWTVDTLFYAIPCDEENINFMYDTFQIIDWKSKDESTGVPSLSKNAINDTVVFVPSSLEQKKIGQYFERLDNLIAIHERKYKSLKHLKSALFHKMFVQGE